MVAIGARHRSYGDFKGRVRLRRSAPGDASLVINRLQSDDTGRYRCEIIDGLEDESITVHLKFRGASLTPICNQWKCTSKVFASKLDRAS